MKKMGRPKGDNNMERVCTIRMDESTLARLEAYCEKKDIAKSEAIRDAITHLIGEVSKKVLSKLLRVLIIGVTFLYY